MYNITRKTYLAKNLKRMQKLYPLEFDFFPKTWVLPNELNELRTFASQKTKPPEEESPDTRQTIDKKPNAGSKLQVSAGTNSVLESPMKEPTKNPSFVQ